MPQSFSAIFLHIVFSTKTRESMISDSIAPRLHGYLAEVCRAMDSPALAVGGMPDHVHLMCCLSRTGRVSDLVEEIKKRSSKWMKSERDGNRDFQWQTGYSVFSIGASGRDDLRRYIDNQREHHRKMSFQDEVRAFFKRYGIEPDEKHMWG